MFHGMDKVALPLSLMPQIAATHTSCATGPRDSINEIGGSTPAEMVAGAKIGKSLIENRDRLTRSRVEIRKILRSGDRSDRPSPVAMSRAQTPSGSRAGSLFLARESHDKAKKHANGLTRRILGEERIQDKNTLNHHRSVFINNPLHLFTPPIPASALVYRPRRPNSSSLLQTRPQSTMVAHPSIGLGPYGTSQKSARSSTTDASTPKLDASQVEDIFQQLNSSQEQVPASSSSNRFGWFSRQ